MGASVEDALQKLVRHPLVLLQRQAEERCLEKPGANRYIQHRWPHPEELCSVSQVEQRRGNESTLSRLGSN